MGQALEVESAAFRQELFRLVKRRLRDDADADDVTQEVMLRLAEHPDRTPPDTPIAWLSRVVANASIDHFRRRSSEARALGRALEEERVRQSGTHSEEAEQLRAGLAHCLEPFLARLEARDREALELTDLGTLTQRAAAEQLAVPNSTLKSRVQRARAQLKDALQACCRFEVDGRGAPIAVQPRASHRDNCQCSDCH